MSQNVRKILKGEWEGQSKLRAEIYALEAEYPELKEGCALDISSVTTESIIALGKLKDLRTRLAASGLNDIAKKLHELVNETMRELQSMIE